MRSIVIKKINNVQPYVLSNIGFVRIDSEASGDFTGIECTVVREDSDSEEELVLILPRGDEPCEGTYLLADAIREE